MTGRLQNKVAVVTGASRGIGRACALALAREGAHIVATARTQADLEELAREIEALGVRALVVTADLSQEQDVDRLAQMTQQTFGRADILVNNAGVGKNGTVSTLTIEDFDWIMNTNFRSTFLCTKAFMLGMIERKDGAIIFVSSVAGLMGLPNEPIYCASKHAQIGFAQSIDYEAYPNNVKISVVAPGGTNTYYGFYNGTRTPGDPLLEQFLESEDVAEAVVFAATQPPKSRTFLIGMRPMSEALGQGSGTYFTGEAKE
jgi:NAD(P)-dependent dehydrogenase (short-subunit alcohol dehydrogenase family)